MPHYVVRMQEVQAAWQRDLANMWLNKDSLAHATQTACRDINPLLNRA